MMETNELVVEQALMYVQFLETKTIRNYKSSACTLIYTLLLSSIHILQFPYIRMHIYITEADVNDMMHFQWSDTVDSYEASHLIQRLTPV